MDRQIRRVGLGLLIGFLAVFFQLNYIQIFAAEDIAGNPANFRAVLREYAIRRGDILTLDGVPLARSRATRGQLKYQRVYPQADLFAHITGFYSIVFGESRIESTFNDQLLGESDVISMQDIEDRFLEGGERGDNVRLTIDSELQRIARDALAGQEGAVVALDPSTGEVRAMYSNPSYDPNPLASHTPKEERDHWRSLDPGSPRSPLISRATSLTYAPGSTFKIVTGAAALESGRYTRNSTFPDPVELELPLTNETLQNFTKTSCAGGGSINLFEAMRISCDTTFGQIGLKIPDEVESMADALGFNEPIETDLGTAASAYPHIPDDSEPLRAFAGIGQADVAATPLQMALVAATVANGGEVPRPRFVREVIDASGGLVDRFSPETLGRAMSPTTAATLTDMMQAVVQSGTGIAAQIPGIEVAGKTGTAQTGVEGAAPHAWFIAFAPVPRPRLAVAVLVENGGTVGSEATGGRVAAPVAKALIEADRRLRGW